MRIRLYSIPTFDLGASMSLSFVSAGGGSIQSTTIEIGPPIPDNAIRLPRADEIFTVQGIARNSLQSGDTIQLLTSDGFFVGIDHDEEDHSDTVIASDTVVGVGNTFTVTLIDDADRNQDLAEVADLDGLAPLQPVAFLGRVGYLGFSAQGDGPLELFDAPLDLGSVFATNRSIFALDYVPALPMPNRPHRRITTRGPHT